MTDVLQQRELCFSVPTDHPSFAGHFLGNPLVPGALLLRWMIEALQQQNIAVYLIKQCKFLNIVRPGDQLRFHLTINNGSVAVDIFCAATPVAKAHCLYRPQDPTHE